MNGVFLRKPQPHEIAESEEQDSHEHQSVDSIRKSQKWANFRDFLREVKRRPNFFVKIKFIFRRLFRFENLKK